MMSIRCQRFGLAAVLCLVAGVAIATPQQDDGQWHTDAQGNYVPNYQKPDWQRRVEQQERDQRQQERDQEWQRQQQEELNQRADWQHRNDDAWQRQQEEIINRQAGYQVYGTHRHGDWMRGHRYDGPVVVVQDYDRYRLRPPPRGSYWVRGDAGNYLLVAVATGVILDIASH